MPMRELVNKMKFANLELFKFISVCIITISISFLATADSPHVQFLKHKHLAKVADTGILTIVKNPAANRVSRSGTSAALVENPFITVSYRAGRSQLAMIPVLNISDAILSADKSLLILLESTLQQSEEEINSINRIIFFSPEYQKIINAFEFKNSKKEYLRGELAADNTLLIEEFCRKENTHFISLYKLNAENYQTPITSTPISAQISDVKSSENTFLVKLENNELLAFSNGELRSRFNCRRQGGKIILTENNDIINITPSGVETLRLSSSGKLYSADFADLKLPKKIDFAVALKKDLSLIVAGTDSEIMQIANLNTALESDLETSKGIIAFNQAQNYLLTVSEKKEELKLEDQATSDITEINYNKITPRSKTLIDKLFFVGDQDCDIMILCESGELFLLRKVRRTYKKNLLFKF